MIEPKDMNSMRANFLRKRKLPIFGNAYLNGGLTFFNGGQLIVEPSSQEARYAGLRSSLKD
jgi:hypothetical protein